MARPDRRYIFVLAGVAAAILVLGALLRPAPVADEPLVGPPSQAELSRLTRLTQRRSLEAMQEFFTAVANDADRSVVRLRMLGRSGVVWAPGIVVTARLEHRFPSTTTVSGTAGELGVPHAGGGPYLPLALLDIPETDEFIPVRRRDAATLASGAWTVFVSDRQGAGFSPATFIETAEVSCQGRALRDVVTSVALGPELAGAGLFDLDNNLLAVVLPCDDRFVAVTAEDVDALAREAETVRARIAQRYGMTLDAVKPEEQAHLGVAFGVIVRDVWGGDLADAVGLRPGDVVVAINAELIHDIEQLGPLADGIAPLRHGAGDVAGDGAEDTAVEEGEDGVVEEGEDAAGEEDEDAAPDAAGNAETESGEDEAVPPAYDVAVVRGGEVIVVSLPVVGPLTLAAAGEAGATEALVWDDPARGYRLDAVRPGTPAARAGLQAGDRLLRIDGEAPATLDEVRAALAPDREAPVLLELERGPRRTAVFLP